MKRLRPISILTVLVLVLASCSDDAPTSPENENGEDTTPQQYTLTLTASPEEGGSVSPEGANEFDEGEEVEITAEPERGWRFVMWEGDINGEENPKKFPSLTVKKFQRFSNLLSTSMKMVLRFVAKQPKFMIKAE